MLTRSGNNYKTSSKDKGKEETIKLVTYNIVSARRNRLEMALRAMYLMNVDLGFFTEAKITDDKYTRNAFEYNTIASKASSYSKGGILLFWKNKMVNWSLESPMIHGPNVISCIIVSGYKRWLLIGAYISPNETNETTLENIEIASQRYNHPLIVCGDFNINTNSEDERDIKILASFANNGLSDIKNKFKAPRKFLHLNTWRSYDKRMSSCCDYIFSNDTKCWKNIRYVEPRHFSSDHIALMGILIIRSSVHHKRYIRRRQKVPFITKEVSDLDISFENLISNIKKTEKRGPNGYLSWISERTWGFIDKKAGLRRNSKIEKKTLKRINRRIRCCLKTDRRRRTEQVGEEMEMKLERNDIRGAWSKFKYWYRNCGKAYAPTHEDLEKITDEYEDLYKKRPHDNDNIPIHVEKFDISDEIPTIDEIIISVRTLKNRKSPGPSKIQAEDIKFWMNDFNNIIDNLSEENCIESAILNDETQSKIDDHPWSHLTSIIQEIFKTGNIPQKMTWEILVLIPKDSVKYRGIGLLYAVWKLCSSIINKRLINRIQYHEALHGFRKSRGTGTAILEAKLLVSLAEKSGRTVYQAFIDLSKAYDSISREKIMFILERYGVGPRILIFWRTSGKIKSFLQNKIISMEELSMLEEG